MFVVNYFFDKKLKMKTAYVDDGIFFGWWLLFGVKVECKKFVIEVIE